MLARTSPLRRATAGAVLTGFASEGLFIVSGVLAARLLGVTDRGVLALVLLFPAVIVRVGGLGMQASVTYYVAKGVALDRLWSVIRRAFVTQAVALTLLQILVVVALVDLRSEVTVSVGAATVIGVPPLLLGHYSLAVLQGLRRFKPFNILRLMRGAAYALFVTGLFVGAIAEVQAVVLAWVVATAVPAAIGALLVGRALRQSYVGTSVAEPTLREIVTFGLRGLVSTASPTETFRIDQAIVGTLLSPHALGLYVVGVAFTNFSRMLGLNLGIVAYPTLASQASLCELRRLAFLFTVVAAVLLGAVSLVLVFAAPLLVPMLFGSDFEPAVSTTQLLLIGGFFWGLRRVVTEIARGVGKPGAGSWAEGLSWAVLLPSIAALLPPLGLNGVALSFMLSSAVSLAALLGLLGRHLSRGRDDRLRQPVGEG